MRSPRAVVIGAIVVPLVLGGCGKGSGAGSAGGPVHGGAGSGKPSASPAGPTVPVADFCAGLDDLNGTAQQVGLDRSLAAVRTDLQQSAAKADEVLSGGLPDTPGVQPFLGHLVSDLRTIAAWADTTATQSDLDTDTVPADVRKSVDDMGFDFRQLQQWAIANCKGQQQGDGH